MFLSDKQTAQEIMRSIGVVFVYGIAFWRIFQRNRGDRFVEYALITTMLLITVAELHRFPNIPSWVMTSLYPLIVIFCFLSLFFLFQQGYRWIRDRLRSAPR
jgi:hypothetical protein